MLFEKMSKEYSLQVDVIEAQSSILAQRIANAQDFSEAERAHQTFMDTVVTQSFLDMKAISQMLEGVFSLCQRLCGFVQVSKFIANAALPAFSCTYASSAHDRLCPCTSTTCSVEYVLGIWSMHVTAYQSVSEAKQVVHVWP